MGSISISTEAEWLAVRDAHVGGSDVAALFNRWRGPDGAALVLHAWETPPDGARFAGSCSPYKSAHALWLEKAGRVMPAGWNPSERMEAGTHLEPAIAAWAGARWDWKLRKVRRYHTHPSVAGWGASVDFEAVEPGMPPVEIKNVDGLVARRAWVVEGEEVLDAPLHVLLQLQHYLGARGAAQGWLLACVGGNRLARGRFPAHLRTQMKIAEAVGAFWEAVRAGEAPRLAADYASVAVEWAEGDGEGAEAPGEIPGEIPGEAPADLSDDGEADALCRRYLRWKAHAEAVETTLDNLKARVAAKLGPASRGLSRGHRLAWPVIRRAEKLVPERLQPAKTYRGALLVSARKEA